MTAYKTQHNQMADVINVWVNVRALSPKKELSTEYMKQLNTDNIQHTAQPDGRRN